MKKFTFRLLFGIILVNLFIINAQANTKETVTFVRCVDGDTALFKIKNVDTKVRFLAIDTPETVHPNMAVQPYGKNASEYTCTKITKAKKIVLEYDSGSTALDKYGRTLAWVWVDDSLLQKELISVGYAKVKYIYGKYTYTQELYDEQEKAKEKKLGLWSDYSPVTYIVTFDEDGNTKKIKVNEDETVTSYTPKKDGYSFIGWYLNNKKFDFDTKITSNITLKAKYEKKYSTEEIIILVLLILLSLIFNKSKTKKKLKKLI
jgi:micrococcal nuclease